MIEVREIETKLTYPLRIEILRNGIAKNYHFVGDDKTTTIHLGAFKKKILIGILTLIQKKHPKMDSTLSYQLRGMAVSKKYQKQGIGSILIQESSQQLAQRHCNLVWCNAREIAVGFYENLNFRILGNSFQIPGIGTHFTMFKQI